jgi:hypothetical protein
VEAVRRARSLLIALLLAGALSAQEAKRDKTLHVIPIEEFLPRATLAFVSVPDGRTALRILERAGEDRKALAARLAKRAGVAAGPLATLLEILAATADGPVTFSLHREFVRGRGVKTQVLVTAATRRRGRALEDAGKNLVRSLLVPMFATEVNGNRLMGVPVVRLRGEDTELYHTTTRGYLMFSTSSLLLGRVLKEMQSPTGNTLKYTPDWVGATLRAKREKGEGALFVSDPSVLPWLDTLGATSVAGRLARDGDGFRDEVFLVTEKGPLAHLGDKGGVPAALSKPGRGRVWIGAALTPRGVLSLLLRSFDRAHAPLMIPVGDVAAGGVEVLLAPSRRCARVRMRRGRSRISAGSRASRGTSSSSPTTPRLSPRRRAERARPGRAAGRPGSRRRCRAC